MARLPLLLRHTCTALASLGLLACAGSGSQDGDIGASDFLSHIPGFDGLDNGGESSADDAGASTGGLSAAPDDGGGEGAERLIAEADLIQRDGDYLYALSQFGGLSVIDVSQPSQLRVLGTYRAEAMPFEMYLSDGVAHVLFNDFGGWEVEEDGTWSYRSGARVQVLDVADPAHIALLGERRVPGYIADSRKVGEILYLVSNEDGYCWRCEGDSNTRVSSFDVSTPDDFRLVDRVILTDPEDAFPWGRSIAVTAERIYVADNSYAADDWQGHGAVDVIDISDAAGDLVQGAHLQLNGPIESRWQMDEYQGTLRVISQNGGSGSGQEPVLETFTVESASSITPLASLPLVLPRPETLQSVRFDGARAFAVTFERTDPLFTFDLSDPAAPAQMGELEIPGFIYHMEPRGNRLFTIGFDNSVAGTSLHASIYDVSDLTQPTQLSRVNFGGDWGNFAEDQDRIHKAFQIDLDAGLIAIPFSGYSYGDESSCVAGSISGIQLIDATTESLTLRGVAPQFGQARRAVLLDDALLGVSDFSVESFDISDRSKPKKLDRVELARNVTALRRVGSTLLRFGQDYWLDQSSLDFVRIEDAEEPQGLGTLDLSDVARADGCGGYAFWDDQVLVHGSYAYLPRRGYTKSNGKDEAFLDVYIVDLRDRSKPLLVGSRRLGTGESSQFSRLLLVGDALLLGREKGSYHFDPWTGERSKIELGYDVFGLEDPLEPKLLAHVELPERMASGGFGQGTPGCTVDMGWGFWDGYGYYGHARGLAAFVSGNIVASQHEEAVNDGTGRVRYYLDRLDVSDPARPVLLPPVNIPGSLVHFEPGRAITLDYTMQSHHADEWSECSGALDNFDYDHGICRVYERRLNALELQGNVAVRTALEKLDPGSSRPGQLAASSSHVFSISSDEQGNSSVRTFTWSDDGSLERASSVDLASVWVGSVVARGGRAFITGSGPLEVVDARDGAPRVTSYPMSGYGCQGMEVADDSVFCALGANGVQSIELP